MLESLFSEDALLGLAMLCVVILAALSLPRCLLRRLNQTSEQFRKLNPFVKVFFGIFFFVFVVHGSFKQNSTNTQSSSLFASRHSPTVQSANLTEFAVRNWNIVGAWDDSFWCKFENDFVFPYGTNHLKGVEVLASGVLWKGPFNPEVISSLGSSVELAAGVSQFSCEYFAASETNEAKYVYSWYNGLVNRKTNSVINGRVELRRSGDILVATNGVEQLIPRQLPFEHNGFGQDSEWVAANFTNANEILSVGYSQWVDDQVGVDLTNGLYKLTVTIPEKPLETTQLKVGDYSVAVTNAGEYVFLLEKGVEYQFTTWPFVQTAVYNWTDDLENNSYSEIEELNANAGAGVWTEDGGVEASYPTKYNPGIIVWLPRLRGSPDILHLKDGDFPKAFSAMFSDCRIDESAIHCEWITADDRISIASPNSRETLVYVDGMPRRENFDLSVRVRIANRMLYSTLSGATYGTNENPMVMCAISAPSALILKSKQMEGSKPGSVVVSMISDVETNGILRVSLLQGAEKVSVSPSLPKEISIDDIKSYNCKFDIDGLSESSQDGDVRLKCEFIDASSNSMSAETALTVLNPSSLIIRGAPDMGMCVVKGTPVGAFFEVLPSDSVVSTKIEWYTARRRNNGSYDEWQLLYNAGRDASIPTPSAGVFALKARLVYGTQSNETAYVHLQDEPYSATIGESLGLNKSGWMNHFGVARNAGLLQLRNTALQYSGKKEYGFNTGLSAKNDYVAIGPKKWKCNRFVADVAIEAGFFVPHNKSWIYGNVYPPVANDWATGDNLTGWIHLGCVYPEPGFIAGHYKHNDSGHCGIVDYDGWTISARKNGVGRASEKMLDGTVKYNIPEE